MKCVVVGCSQTFRSHSAFSSHLSRKHRGVDFESEARITILNFCSRESEEVDLLRSSGDASASASSMETDMDVGVSVDTE